MNPVTATGATESAETVFRDRGTIIATLTARVAVLETERDQAREECGHEKAMRAHLHEELSTWIGLRAEERVRADAAEAETRALRDRMTALADEWESFGPTDVAWHWDRLGMRVRAALAASPAVDATPEPVPAAEPQAEGGA